MKSVVYKYCIAFIFLAILAGEIRAQECENQYSSNILRGTSFNNYITAISTTNKELIATGEVYKDNGFVAKYTTKGNPIWSYQYRVPYRYNQVFYLSLQFNSLLPSPDGGFYAAGRVTRVGSDSNMLAIVAHLDKFGVVKWSKSFRAIYGKHLSINNMIETSDHDLILYMGCDKGSQNFSYSKVIRMSNLGVIKWVSQLHTGSFDAGKFGNSFRRCLFQKSNGDIVVSDVVYQIDRNTINFAIKESDLHFLGLDYNTGKLKWETSYEYPRPDVSPYFIPQLTGITELPNGNLRFFTSLMMPAANMPGNTLKAFSILTDPTGHIEDITSYYNADNSSCELKQVISDRNSGNSILLFNKNQLASLSLSNNNGQLNWTKTFTNENGLYPPACVTNANNGYAIWMAGFNDWKSRLVITDREGTAECIAMPGEIIVDKASLSYHAFNVTTGVPADFKDPFEYDNIELAAESYEFQNRTECQKAIDCCKDKIDSININQIQFCEGQSALLPDNTVIRDSGTYYVTFKTNRGCDSIRFYQAHIIKDPAKLSLGQDTCMKDLSQITLEATAGFINYTWLGIAGTNNHYTIKQPGTYWVSVRNSCGSKTDSIEVYKECEFPVFIPSAFSPNGDNLNDVFRVPALNKNRFVRLRIHNRWGQLVFESSNQLLGWDGKLKGVLQDSGVFIYFLEMENLSGQKFVQKGTVTLLR